MTTSNAQPWYRPLLRVMVTLGAVLAVFGLQRVAFYLLNADSFPAPPLVAFLGGMRFDASAIAWLFLPWTVSMLVRPGSSGAWNTVQKGLFHLSTVICFFLNCVDLEYYKFTMKRSTADLLGIAAGGNDLSHLAPVFAADFWYVVVIFLVSLVVAEAAYRWAAKRWPERNASHWWGWRMALIVLTAFFSRGGVQYMPLAVLDASAYASPAYLPLVLNTPFTVMTSIGKPMLTAVDYMPQAEADRVWPVVHRYGDNKTVLGTPNIVVVVLESFSGTYSSVLNGGREGYMPFLDSLMRQGLCYTQAHANGRRSIDGLPAIVASMPKMMEEAFITSPYADAPFTSLPNVLAKAGYRSSFYHGGHNGTMGFDGFTRSAGYQRYVGRDQYPTASDDDGVWGIRDRPFLRYYADELNKEQQPFFSTVFTLSSHHPYKLEEADAKRFACGNLTIHPTLRYADDALRGFFEHARTMPWFANTLFVITADHTADLERNGEQSGSAFDFWIPLVYYMPGTIAPRMDARITQQIDILPTVLDLIGWQEPFFAFGSSSLRSERPPAAISQGNATWLMVAQTVQLRSDGERILWHEGIGSTWTPELRTQPSALEITSAQGLLRASIQQFNTHLLQRDMVVPER